MVADPIREVAIRIREVAIRIREVADRIREAVVCTAAGPEAVASWPEISGWLSRSQALSGGERRAIVEAFGLASRPAPEAGGEVAVLVGDEVAHDAKRERHEAV